MIYLDNAATTLKKPPAVARAMREALRRGGGAGRGGHEAAMWSADKILACRQEAALLFGVPDPERVTLVGNATHALNTAISSVAKRPGRILTSGFEHNAVMRPLEALKEKGYSVETLATPLFEPEVVVHRFEEALRGDVVFAACTVVSNVFGYVLPIERIARLCRDRGVPLVVDASQAAGCLTVDAGVLAGAYIGMPGHKGLYGPQGTGLLISPEGVMPNPILRGGTGSQSVGMHMPDFLPDRLEAGTQNTPGVAGLLEGLRYVKKRGTGAILRHERALTAQLIQAMSGHRRLRLYYADHLFCQTGVLAFNVLDADPECIAEQLARKGMAVRAGLHCAPEAHRSAGTFPVGAVRVSVSDFNTAREIENFIRALEEML